MKKIFFTLVFCGVLGLVFLGTNSFAQAPAPPAPGELWPPEKITPEDGKKNTESPVHFEWKPGAPDTDKYQLLVYEADTSRVVLDETFGASTQSYNFSLSEDGASYRWYVKACKSEWGWIGDDCDDRPFGDPYYFAMAGGEPPPGTPPAPPPAGTIWPPEKITPEDGKKNTESPVHFEWKPGAPDTDKYQLLVYEADSLSPTTIINQTFNASTYSYDHNLPEDGTTYQWYVKACKSVGLGGDDCNQQPIGIGYVFTMAGVPTGGIPGPPFPGMCEEDFTDSRGETHSADAWCSDCPDGPYDFCKGDKHYRFGCIKEGANCDCNPNDTLYESCASGCDSWDCGPGSGCFAGECKSIASPTPPVPSPPTPSPPTPKPPGGGISVELKNPLQYDTVEDILGAVSVFLFQIGMSLATVMLIIAGFMFVTAGGSPEKALTARKMAIYTLIGLAIILLASGLIAVLKSILGVKEEVFILLTYLT